jgi:hypothetical protein
LLSFTKNNSDESFSCCYTLVFAVCCVLASGDRSVVSFPDHLAYSFAIQNCRAHNRSAVQIHRRNSDVPFQDLKSNLIFSVLVK